MNEKRSIKFRAWDGIMMHSWNLMDAQSDWVNPDNYTSEPMQFTGLLDKNGKEIYEGDIVNQEKWVSVGQYVRTVGVVKYKGTGFTCECKGEWEGSNADLNGNAVVIGNIHENQELLNF